jgi:hypothetical protein
LFTYIEPIIALKKIKKNTNLGRIENNPVLENMATVPQSAKKTRLMMAQ